jgi:hypothetical protein
MSETTRLGVTFMLRILCGTIRYLPGGSGGTSLPNWMVESTR